jgi:hypothetical protein
MRATIKPMQSFTRGEQKPLAYHRVVAEKLRANPSLVDSASRRLQWLREINPAARTYYDGWQRLLQGPLDELIAALLSESEHNCALRQENPFCRNVLRSTVSLPNKSIAITSMQRAALEHLHCVNAVKRELTP